MIHQYVNKLIENLDLKPNAKERLDLIFDGGVFNGSYLIGAAYFLKQMEHNYYIKIERISGCSIGSFVSLLYITNCLDLFTEFYEIVASHFKTTYNLNVFKEVIKKIEPRLPKNICALMSVKIYISFYDLKKRKKIIKHKYKSVDDIFETIYKSCFVPFLMNGNIAYNGRYIDGISPHIFKKETNKKMLFIDLFGYDKIGYLINIKNEKTTYHRVLSGLLDIHNFYIKKSNTYMCSYVQDWNICNRSHYLLKQVIEFFIVCAVQLLIYLKKMVPEEFYDNIISKIFIKIINDIYIILIESYCF